MIDKDIVAAERDFLTPMGGEEEIKEEAPAEGGIDTDIDVNAIAQDEVMNLNDEEKAEEAVLEEGEAEELVGDTELDLDIIDDVESTDEDIMPSEDGELSLEDLFTAIDELGDAPDEAVEEIQELAGADLNEEANAKLEELKTTLLDREQRISEIESSLNMYKSKLEEANDGLIDRDLNDSRIAPYIDVLEDNDALKASVVYLAKYNKNGNEGMKEQSIDALYDYLSTETGHDVKGMIEKEISKGAEGLEGYEGGAGDLEAGSKGTKTMNLWN